MPPIYAPSLPTKSREVAVPKSRTMAGSQKNHGERRYLLAYQTQLAQDDQFERYPRSTLPLPITGFKPKPLDDNSLNLSNLGTTQATIMPDTQSKPRFSIAKNCFKQPILSVVR